MEPPSLPTPGLPGSLCPGSLGVRLWTGKTKRYAIVDEERYGHKLGLGPRVYESPAVALAEADRLAESSGLKFTVVELVPVQLPA